MPLELLQNDKYSRPPKAIWGLAKTTDLASLLYHSRNPKDVVPRSQVSAIYILRCAIRSLTNSTFDIFSRASWWHNTTTSSISVLMPVYYIYLKKWLLWGLPGNNVHISRKIYLTFKVVKIPPLAQIFFSYHYSLHLYS